MSLLEKYDVPGPRYTSYPTVPYWNGKPSIDEWKSNLESNFLSANKKGISLYLHLPFCEEYCTFCACNKVITKNHNVEKPYLDALAQEWEMYLSIFPDRPKIQEIYLGGGTPTFFSPEHLTQLFEFLGKNADILNSATISVEVNPMKVSYEQLKALRNKGVNRISLGIQDSNKKVQEAINRLQPNKTVVEVMNWISDLGFKETNFDLIYGLPFQTTSSIIDTIKLVEKLQPSRIAFYSYAHVPWKKNAQRLFTENDLPTGSGKWDLFNAGKKHLEQIGYESIGMDHFALPDDSLAKAHQSGNLHRNFMGYTTTDSKWLIGLGASSISETRDLYVQNEKNAYTYQKKIAQGNFTFTNGTKLTDTDKIVQRHIKALMCQYKTTFNDSEFEQNLYKQAKQDLAEMEKDNLLVFSDNRLSVTESGENFVRNICMSFDQYLNNSDNIKEKQFSKTI